MRVFQCECRQPIFVDNSVCLKCARPLGFCPVCRNLAALESRNDGSFKCLAPGCGAALAKCFNYAEHDVCNRCVALPAAPGTLCDCCRFNAVIPDLAVPGNKQKWYRLEAAKRRLFYDLGELGLPYGMECDGIQPPLSFDFRADVIPKDNIWRKVGATERVFTGHANGRITINIREADDAEREKLRVEMGEAHRTLIGHFRHEIGHYYWDMLVKVRRENQFIAAFGDHRQPTYAEALERHYQNGPPANWAERYVSPYATMHPWEDFAETWATYLDIVSELDTAADRGFGGTSNPLDTGIDAMVARYQELGIALNEINRSLGLLDLVPEVFVPPVVEKLRYVHELVQIGRAENRALGGPPATPAADQASAGNRSCTPAAAPA